MDPITMMVASIGMQFFNNYANSKKNEEIQEKQREFQRAAAEHDFERMRKLQAESAKLALELEAEVHKERVEDINNNYDALLDNFAHSFAIQNWPLNVLPFVMKGESFGTLFNGTTQSVNLHCILTPSNCEWFNREFYDDIDLRLEAEMNNKWNAQTTHPIVYYGGARNRRSMNRGISVPNVVDLDDIELLRVKLKDVPVVVITPYFDPWLHFKVKLWGMGKDSEAPYRIDITHGNDIEYSQRIFSYDYHKDQTELTEDFENTTIEEFVPYLECLIGFIADKYFWSMYGIPTSLPTFLCNNINLHKNKEYYSEKYYALLTDVSEKGLPVIDNKQIWALYASSKKLLNSESQNKCFIRTLNFIAKKKGFLRFEQSEDFKSAFSTEDKDLVDDIVTQLPDGELRNYFMDVSQLIEGQIPCVYAEEETITFLDILDYALQISEDLPCCDIKININDETIVIGVLEADGKNIVSDIESPKCLVLKYQELVLADRLKIQSTSFILKGSEIKSMYQQIKKLY